MAGLVLARVVDPVTAQPLVGIITGNIEIQISLSVFAARKIEAGYSIFIVPE